MITDRSINILIVDDFPLTLQFIEYHLQLAGYKNTVSFENPFDAVSHIRNGNSPKLIITDLQMPQINGLEFLELIKDNFGIIPSIVTTADISFVQSGTIQYPVLLKGTPDFVVQLLNQIKMTYHNFMITV